MFAAAWEANQVSPAVNTGNNAHKIKHRMTQSLFLKNQNIKEYTFQWVWIVVLSENFEGYMTIHNR